MDWVWRFGAMRVASGTLKVIKMVSDMYAMRSRNGYCSIEMILG